jgi:hypothetical protein
MVLAPVLVPLAITGVHIVANWWRSDQPSLSITPLRLARSPENL